MAFSLTWLPDELKKAGLKVALVDGWENRGLGDVGQTLGVICHHTAGPRGNNMPTLDTLIKGRSNLSGPLSQLGLGRDGTFYVIASGRCNHAGKGVWKGVDAGNTHFIGIEAEHTGDAMDPWPAVQMDAYQRGVAAILKRAGRAVDDCIGHKEWAPGRKPDPTFDMVAFRIKVAAILAGSAPAPALIPAAEPAPVTGTAARATLRRGSSGELVMRLQTLLALKVDGSFGPRTEAAIRAVQRSLQIVPDGIVGPKTWVALDGTSPALLQSAAASAMTEAAAVAPVPVAVAAAEAGAAPFIPGEDEALSAGPWPNKLASKMVASYLRFKFGMSAGELLFRNPPMGAMPFFNNSASAAVREAELALVAGEMLRHFTELQIPLEAGRSTHEAHQELLVAMIPETALSSGMAVAVDNNYRFSDEA